MRLEVYSVFDEAVKAFLPPFFLRSRGEAIRSFAAAVNDPQHQFHKHTKDYVLFMCGVFDDGSGTFDLLARGPELVISGLQVSEPA